MATHSLYMFHAESRGTREGGEEIKKKRSKDTADIWAVISGIIWTVYSVEEFDF